MAHYAFLDNNNIVTHVIPGVDEWETIEGLHPEEWYSRFVEQPCKRTSYNTVGGKHITGGVPFRGNYAGIGFTYDEELDAFIAPKPFDSWTLDEGTFSWVAPVPYPEDGNQYVWNEETGAWIEA
jgi:hypothetical protein